MRSYAPFLLLAAVSAGAITSPVLAQRVTNDVDAAEVRQRGREVMVERRERQQAQTQTEQTPQAPVFQQRPPRDFGATVPQRRVDNTQNRGMADPRFNRQPGGFEVRNDNGDGFRRPDPRRQNGQSVVDVRPDDRRFGNRGWRGEVSNAPPPNTGATSGNDRNRFGMRGVEPRDGQRFGRDEEYRGDRDERRRNDRDDFRRRGELARDGIWYRDNKGRWQKRDDHAYDHRGYRDHYSGRDYRWNRDWRRDSRYDWQAYRYANRNFYRLSPYYDPFGSRFGYRRFSIGIQIGSGYYSDRYWISDPFAYRLPYADGPYRWIRYYDDVLLIDIRNGYVVDVIYDFFW